MRSLRSAILREVFGTQTVNGMFKDAIHAYYATAAAMSGVTPKRKGQLCYGVSGTTKRAYLAYGTAVGEWAKVPIPT